LLSKQLTYRTLRSPYCSDETATLSDVMLHIFKVSFLMLAVFCVLHSSYPILYVRP